MDSGRPEPKSGGGELESKAQRRGAQRRQALTAYSKFRRIRSDRYGSLVIRLMMAANDISLANWSLVRFQGTLPRMERHMQAGAVQYFVRLMCGHLHEAVDLIDEVRQEQDLVDFIARCSAEMRGAYRNLCDCLPRGKDRHNFANYVVRMRNKIAFHYDDAHVKEALEQLARATPPPPAKITLGMDYFLSRFNLADVVMDSITVRQLIPDFRFPS